MSTYYNMYSIYIIFQTNTFLEKMKCDIRLMIDCDVAEKKN